MVSDSGQNANNGHALKHGLVNHGAVSPVNGSANGHGALPTSNDHNSRNSIDKAGMERVAHELRQQEELRRQIRPLAPQDKIKPLLAERSARVRFRLSPVEEPSGDEQQILRPLPGIVKEFDTIIDAEGHSRVVPRDPDTVQAELRREIFKRAAAEEQLTMDDLLPQRIKVAWRFVREWCRIKGLCAEDEPLIEALKPSPMCIDPWRVPRAPYVPPRGIGTLLPSEIMKLIDDSEHIAEDLSCQRFDWEQNKWVHYPGLAVLPPEVPSRWWDADCNIKDDYDLEQDRMLGLYVQLVRTVTKRLYVDQGSFEDRDQGRLGLVGLIDHDLIRLAFPTRLQILTWEEMLVEETLDLIIATSTHTTKKKLKSKYGFQDRECATLMKLAVRQSMTQTSGDIEEARSIMVMRLEEYVRRTKDALDIRAELNGLKQISIVLGLGNEDKQDIFQGLIEVVKAASTERRALRELNQRKPVDNVAGQAGRKD